MHSPPPIYIVSGGAGASGGQLVHTILVQFADINVPVITVPHVRQMEQIKDVIAQAKHKGGTIVHTLVDTKLRNALNHEAKEQAIVTIDLMGPLLSRLSDLLDQEPLGHPGLYRQLHQDYFERVAAIEFSMAHDDSMNPKDWPMAEIVLTGVSRVGKTPLSIYLSVLGWKVANVPIIMGLPVPKGLFELDHRRVIGLTIEPERLFVHRQQRQRHMGMNMETSDYADPLKIAQEVKAAHHIFQQGGFSVIDVTHKPMETSADEVIELITSRLKAESHKR